MKSWKYSRPRESAEYVHSRRREGEKEEGEGEKGNASLQFKKRFLWATKTASFALKKLLHVEKNIMRDARCVLNQRKKINRTRILSNFGIELPCVFLQFKLWCFLSFFRHVGAPFTELVLRYYPAKQASHPPSSLTSGGERGERTGVQYYYSSHRPLSSIHGVMLFSPFLF